MADWTRRHKLVLAKIAIRLAKRQTKEIWQEIIIETDGKEPKKDNFIEAHIYGGFDVFAIESIIGSPDTKLSREEKNDLDLALAKFERLKKSK